MSNVSLFQNRPKDFLKQNTHSLTLKELEGIVLPNINPSIDLTCYRCKKLYHMTNYNLEDWNKHLKFLKKYTITVDECTFVCVNCLPRGNESSLDQCIFPDDEDQDSEFTFGNTRSDPRRAYMIYR